MSKITRPQRGYLTSPERRTTTKPWGIDDKAWGVDENKPRGKRVDLAPTNGIRACREIVRAFDCIGESSREVAEIWNGKGSVAIRITAIETKRDSLLYLYVKSSRKQKQFNGVEVCSMYYRACVLVLFIMRVTNYEITISFILR